MPSGALRSGGLARKQLNDWDHPARSPGLRAEIGVLGVDAVGKVPQPAPLRLILDDLRTEREASEDDVGILAEVVVQPGCFGQPRDAATIVIRSPSWK